MLNLTAFTNNPPMPPDRETIIDPASIVVVNESKQYFGIKIYYNTL